MPYTLNGIGTSICGARGHVRWGGPASFDAVECLVVFFLPVLPFKTVHTFDWNGTQYRAIPIRWSAGLVLRAFLRRWLWVPTVAVPILGYFLFDESRGGRLPNGLLPRFLLPLLMLAALTALGWWTVLASDRRSRDIRRVLGPHSLGSSDPATWGASVLASARGPRELHGTDTHKAAVPTLLRAGNYASAMWAARLSTALEGRIEGEMLTDSILADPNVQDALGRVRKDPNAWTEAMHPRTS